MSDRDPLLNKCTCCYDWQESCSRYMPGMHRRMIRELSQIFKDYNKYFDEDHYSSFMQEIYKVMKSGNIYLNEEKFMNMVMEKDNS